MKVGDLVSLQFYGREQLCLVVCVCGYKITLLVEGLEEVWTIHDLHTIGAEVLNENR